MSFQIPPADLQSDIDAINAVLDGDDIYLGNDNRHLAPLLKYLDPSQSVGKFANMILFAKTVPQTYLNWRNCDAHKSRLERCQLSNPVRSFEDMRQGIRTRHSAEVMQHSLPMEQGPIITMSSSSAAGNVTGWQYNFPQASPAGVPQYSPSNANAINTAIGSHDEGSHVAGNRVATLTAAGAPHTSLPMVHATTNFATASQPAGNQFEMRNPTATTSRVPQTISAPMTHATSSTAVAPQTVGNRFMRNSPTPTVQAPRNQTVLKDYATTPLPPHRITSDPQLPSPELPSPRLPSPQIPSPRLSTPQLPAPRLPTPPLPRPNSPVQQVPSPLWKQATMHDDTDTVKKDDLLEAKRKKIREAFARGDDVLAYNQKEFLEVYPVPPGQQKNTYHTRLLANQPTFTFTSDEDKEVILYAKENWFNYWETKDKAKVIEWMRKDGWSSKSNA